MINTVGGHSETVLPQGDFVHKRALMGNVTFNVEFVDVFAVWQNLGCSCFVSVLQGGLAQCFEGAEGRTVEALRPSDH